MNRGGGGGDWGPSAKRKVLPSVECEPERRS